MNFLFGVLIGFGLYFFLHYTFNPIIDKKETKREPPKKNFDFKKHACKKCGRPKNNTRNTDYCYICDPAVFD